MLSNWSPSITIRPLSFLVSGFVVWFLSVSFAISVCLAFCRQFSAVVYFFFCLIFSDLFLQISTCLGYFFCSALLLPVLLSPLLSVQLFPLLSVQLVSVSFPFLFPSLFLSFSLSRLIMSVFHQRCHSITLFISFCLFRLLSIVRMFTQSFYQLCRLPLICV